MAKNFSHYNDPFTNTELGDNRKSGGASDQVKDWVKSEIVTQALNAGLST